MGYTQWSKADKPVFMNDESIAQALFDMEQDTLLDTKPGAVTENHIVHLVSFHEKHAHYLKNHPHINPSHYLSNLRIMVKIRPQ
jgi:hypothetical protein